MDIQRHFNHSSRRIGLALQGGGAHGAFTAGVLKHLLNENIINDRNLVSVTGTSAGAMNGAVLTSALNASGQLSVDKNNLAAQKLDAYWESIGTAHQLLSGVHSFSVHMDLLSQMMMGKPLPSGGPQWPNLSKESLKFLRDNPFNVYATQGLKSLLDSHVKNWDELRSGPVALHVNAVRKLDQDGAFSRKNLVNKIFSGADISADSVVASGALRMLGAHKIDGMEHWDGAYLRNPDFAPLMADNLTDLIVVTIQRPPEDPVVKPHDQEELARAEDRLKPTDKTLTHHIFNHVEFLRERQPDLNIHTISLPFAEHWEVSTRYNTNPLWLKELNEMGHKEAESWMQDQAAALNGLKYG